MSFFAETKFGRHPSAFSLKNKIVSLLFPYSWYANFVPLRFIISTDKNYVAAKKSEKGFVKLFENGCLMCVKSNRVQGRCRS
jgi:hypothetical protein